MRRSLLATGLIAAGSVGLVSAANLEYVAGDPLTYHQLTAEIVSGRLPYVDLPFEHLPGVLIPMMAAWFLGGSASAMAYRGVWVLLCLFALLACVRQVEWLDRNIGQKGRVTTRWLVLMSPMIPVLLFRNDIWPVLAALLAIRLYRTRMGAAGAAIIAGALMKGWPIILTAGLFRRPRVAVAVALMAVLPLTGVAISPGFRSGRQFDGLHTETLGGSLAAMVDILSGRAPEYLERAGAIYVSAPNWYALFGIVAGTLIASRAVTLIWRSHQEIVPFMRGLALLLIAIVLAAPLQSTQFLAWPVSFLAFAQRRSVLILYTVAGAAAIWSLALFPLLFEGSLVWHGVAVLRNLAVFGAGLSLAREGKTGESEDAERVGS